MKDTNWEDLRLFWQVARLGGLSAAARAAGVSAPTIGRRMLALERALGRTLFERRKTGYQLAPDGRFLYERVDAMHQAARPLDAWSTGVVELPIVTISAGSWMSRFIAGHLPALWTPSDPFRLCFKSAEARLDLARREADIGIRNQRPESGNVASRRSVAVAFAPYCARGFNQRRDCNWVALGSQVAKTPSARWILDQPDLWITVWADTPRMVHDLIRGGAGRGVLPCFVGDRDPALVRAGPMIAALEHVMWIVMHDDERHRPEVRTVIDRLAALYADHAALFAGRMAEGAPASAASA